METPIASGDNYALTRHGQAVVCRVWRRPDLTRLRGAACAREKIDHSRRLAATDATGFVLDLREAPAVWGPQTHEALAAILAPWEAAGRRVAVVVGDEPIQEITVRELVGAAAPTSGLVTSELSAALAHCQG